MHKSKEIHIQGIYKSREIPVEQMEPFLSGSGISFMANLKFVVKLAIFFKIKIFLYVLYAHAHYLKYIIYIA